MDWGPPGSSVHGVLQARILEFPCPSPGPLPNLGIKSRSLALQADSLPSEPPELCGKYYSAIKKNEILPCAIRWMHLEAIVLEREVIQKKTNTVMLSLICRIWKIKQTCDCNRNKPTHRYREQTSGYQWGEGRRGAVERWGTLLYTVSHRDIYCTGREMEPIFYGNHEWTMHLKIFSQ